MTMIRLTLKLPLVRHNQVLAKRTEDQAQDSSRLQELNPIIANKVLKLPKRIPQLERSGAVGLSILRENSKKVS